jgi:hypothetical protein
MRRVERTQPAGHYETFVVRLWVKAHEGVEHGEVRHLTSGAEMRFRDVRDAIEFIDHVALRDGRRGEPSGKPRRLE